MELGDCGAAGHVFKGAESGGDGWWFRSARVLLGLEVGDGSDKWTPPGSDRGARDHAVSR